MSVKMNFLLLPPVSLGVQSGTGNHTKIWTGKVEYQEVYREKKK